MYSSELYHYGRLGMKWGKHVFGEQHAIHKELSKKSNLDLEENSREKSERKQAGIKRGLFSDKIKSGSSIYRYSDTKNETIDSRRKYASLTETDRRIYKNDAINGVLSNKGKDVYLYQLTASKNLKIAKGERVSKDIIKRYGDKSIKDTYKNVSKYRLRENYHKLQKELRDPTNKNHWMYDKVTKEQEAVSKFIHQKLYDEKSSGEIFDRYRKKGYDAIVDPEDYMDGYYYPVILLNPKSSVKKKSVKRIN